MKIEKDFGIRILDRALKKGADSAEVYIRTGKSLSIEVKKQKVESIDSSISAGFSLRVIRDGRLGFAFSSDPEGSDEVVDKALEASLWTERDEFLCFPENLKTADLNIFDPAIANITEEEAIERALKIEKSALEQDKRIKKVRKASVTFSLKDVYILNSLGLSKHYRTTACTAQTMVVAEDNGEAQMGWDYSGSRFISDVSFEEVGKTAAIRALSLLGARKIRPEKVRLILDNSVATEFLGLFSSLFSSENVQKGKSLLAGRLNQQVLSPLINIVDNATMEHQLGSRPFDDEGFPTERFYLIREGVLQNYMYNTYTAKREGKMSTGNAIRQGYSSLPSIGPSNLYIEPVGNATPLKSIIETLDRGVYITEIMGLHTANPISGDFSIGITGLWIEGGSKKYPFKEAIISGNLLELFNRIEAVGNDLRFYGNVGSPSLLIGPTDLSA